ncbi:MAG TPA: hypothetical protein VN878_02435 [Usitatibacter sp.]|nr:hypothetical protein [Usitatibacter sp.]
MRKVLGVVGKLPPEYAEQFIEDRLGKDEVIAFFDDVAQGLIATTYIRGATRRVPACNIPCGI